MSGVLFLSNCLTVSEISVVVTGREWKSKGLLSCKVLTGILTGGGGLIELTIAEATPAKKLLKLSAISDGLVRKMSLNLIEEMFCSFFLVFYLWLY